MLTTPLTGTYNAKAELIQFFKSLNLQLPAIQCLVLNLYDCNPTYNTVQVILKQQYNYEDMRQLLSMLNTPNEVTSGTIWLKSGAWIERRQAGNGNGYWKYCTVPQIPEICEPLKS